MMEAQQILFHQLAPSLPAVAITEEVSELLANDCAVAIGVSGGRDSQALALQVASYLDKIGHQGPRLLVHSDLGLVEWKESLPVCERLAQHLGWELLVVRKNSGGLMERWEGRWKNNVERYAELACVKLILPWSTPALRFCTSEQKTDVITSALKKRYPDKAILNVVGIRRQESPGRRKMPVSGPLTKLARRNLPGITWNAIIEHEKDDVQSIILNSGLALHEAYTKYGTSRVSCAFCIMSAEADLRAAATCEDNHDLYRRMVKLELDSTFAFQGGKWLADVAPHLLSDTTPGRLAKAKHAAKQRQLAEARIPPHLLYTKGWPTAMPTASEAEMIAEVRNAVADAVKLKIRHTTGDEVMARYGFLINQHS